MAIGCLPQVSASGFPWPSPLCVYFSSSSEDTSPWIEDHILIEADPLYILTLITSEVTLFLNEGPLGDSGCTWIPLNPLL